MSVVSALQAREGATAAMVESWLRGGPAEALDEDECRRLLGTARRGQLVFHTGALPAVRPVSFVLHGGHVHIPVLLGSTALSGLGGSVVAFHVDSFADDARSGWSVTVVGPTLVISEPARVAELDTLVSPGMLVPDHCYVEVRDGLVRGWRAADPTPSLDVLC